MKSKIMTYMGDEHDNQSGPTTISEDKKMQRKLVLFSFEQFEQISNNSIDLDNYLFGQRISHVFS